MRLTFPIITLCALMGASAVQAQECIEPIKPDAGYMHDAGYTGNEIHASFKDYFREVEDFLNCWNSTTYRVHEEARAAAYELETALRKYPTTADRDSAVGNLGGFIASDAPMIDTGQLIMAPPSTAEDNDSGGLILTTPGQSHD